MVISVSTVSPAPPKSWYSGAPKRWAYKSYTAISTAALAEVFFTMLECSLYIMPSQIFDLHAKQGGTDKILDGTADASPWYPR